MGNKKIDFCCRYRSKTLSKLGTIEPVRLANEFIPKWQKDQKLTYVDEQERTRPTSKYCTGIFDYTRAGYIIPAWHDFTFEFSSSDPSKYIFHSPHIWNFINRDLVELHDNTNGLNVNTTADYLTSHEELQAEGASFFESGCKSIAKFMTPWCITVPKGVSIFFTHPFYHVSNHDYTVVPAIVDSDLDVISNREIQVFIKLNTPDKIIKIKRGDPLLQIIPFVRTDFEFSVTTEEEIHPAEKIRINTLTDFDSVIHQNGQKEREEKGFKPLLSNMVKKTWGCPVKH